MLWAKLDAQGILTIQADEPIESYALLQWKKQFDVGGAALKIEAGARLDLPSLIASLGLDIAKFREWKAKCETSIIASEDGPRV